jgi:hypothetical protein
MGCRCADRTDALHRALSAIQRGDSRALVREVNFVGRTLLEDAHNNTVVRAARERFSRMAIVRR